MIASARDRKSTRLNSSHLGISYAVFCLKKKKTKQQPVQKPRRRQRLFSLSRCSTFRSRLKKYWSLLTAKESSIAISSLLFFFFNDTATTKIYTLSLHDALPI